MSYKKIVPKDIKELADVKELDKNVFDMIGNKWMLITAEKDGKVNTMTASWGGMGFMWAKPVAFCVVRPVRYTYEFIEPAEYYTLSFFPEEYKPALNILGTKSGRDGDKISESKLERMAVSLSGNADNTDNINISSFKEANMILVCKKLYHHDIAPENFAEGVADGLEKFYPKKDYHRMYFGEIVEYLIKD